MRRFVAVVLAVLATGLSSSARAETFTLLATERIDLDDGAVIEGSVGVVGATGADNVLQLAHAATISAGGRASAKHVALGLDASTGPIATDDLQDGGGKHGAVSPFQILPPLPDPISGFAGGQMLFVPEHGTVTLPAGISYAYVQLGEGATLLVPPGTHTLGALELATHARVETTGTEPTWLVVTGDLRVAANARLGAEGDGGAVTLFVEVLGLDGATAAVTFADHTWFRGRLIVPNGSVTIGEVSHVRGSIAARRIAVGARTIAKPAGLITCGELGGPWGLPGIRSVRQGRRLHPTRALRVRRGPVPRSAAVLRRAAGSGVLALGGAVSHKPRPVRSTHPGRA